MAMVKQMLKSQSFKQCRLCCFVFLSSANIFVVLFLRKCLDIVSSQMLVILVHKDSIHKKLDYAELSKARDEAKQLQIYKANTEILLRTDAEEQRQTRARQQEK